ncbi:ras-specific guanine nucleotide-releasing factor RalGPS1-like isoform X2 [Apostichopus japonicus]|uniref:ras-specific guanine nucleotide-releasing factor RalGPS1-like isoform X2 n=1 Tax=Stichopus japonicus TaxID=307972 RepID=UPI003AB857AF
MLEGEIPGQNTQNSSDKEQVFDGRWTLPRMKSYDRVVFEMLRVSPEDFATQLTLEDLKIFKQIMPEELASCEWSGKHKNNICPNVVAFSRRFNQVSFWVVKEILESQTSKIRAELIGAYIRIAKKLFDMNNLHSSMAIVSALHSAPIFRLSKTWNAVNRRDRAVCEKMADVMSEDDNRQNLRDYMESIRMPCIPYLGMYLQDLVFIDVAHPSTGGLDSESRSTKMNNILRVISEFQKSDYEYEVLPHIQSYFKSMRYIEELQKFVEDNNYKLSLQLEPPSQIRSKEELDIPTLRISSPGKSNPSTPAPISKFAPGHRKSRSLGSSIPHQVNQIESLSYSNTYTGNGARHLLDDSLLEHVTSPIVRPSVTSSKDGSMNGMSIGSSEDSEYNEDPEVWINPDGSVTESCEDLVHNIPEISQSSFTFSSVLRRKVVRKAGKKLSVTSFTKYWVGLWGTNLLHYAAKHFNSTERADFKSKPCKMFSVNDWLVTMPDTRNENTIILTDPSTGNSYKYKANTYSIACQWIRHLDAATKKHKGTKAPANLMSFE